MIFLKKTNWNRIPCIYWEPRLNIEIVKSRNDKSHPLIATSFTMRNIETRKMHTCFCAVATAVPFPMCCSMLLQIIQFRERIFRNKSIPHNTHIPSYCSFFSLIWRTFSSTSFSHAFRMQKIRKQKCYYAWSSQRNGTENDISQLGAHCHKQNDWHTYFDDFDHFDSSLSSALFDAYFKFSVFRSSPFFWS